MASIVNTLLDRLDNLTREHERLLRLNQDLQASLETMEAAMFSLEGEKNREIERLKEFKSPIPMDIRRTDEFETFKRMLKNATLDGPNGGYIQAVKLARSLGGLGWKEAKDLVQAIGAL